MRIDTGLRDYQGAPLYEGDKYIVEVFWDGKWRGLGDGETTTVREVKREVSKGKSSYILLRPDGTNQIMNGSHLESHVYTHMTGTANPFRVIKL